MEKRFTLKIGQTAGIALNIAYNVTFAEAKSLVKQIEAINPCTIYKPEYTQFCHNELSYGGYELFRQHSLIVYVFVQ